MVTFGKWLLLFILAVVIIIFSAKPQIAPVVSNLSLQKVLAALGGIFIIVLLVERATEIIISIWRQAPTDKMEKELSTLSGDPKARKAEELVNYKAETKSISLLVGFTLSVVVCSAGLGLLGEIIDVEKGNTNFLRGVDIILTSGLIAGGSDAFHQFVRALETFFKTSKEKMENLS